MNHRSEELSEAELSAALTLSEVLVWVEDADAVLGTQLLLLLLELSSKGRCGCVLDQEPKRGKDSSGRRHCAA